MWSSIIGHSNQIIQLRRALSLGRLPNSWLFAGPRGIGKRLVANVVALKLVCEHLGTEDLEPCGKCIACRRVASGNHPDIIIITPESQDPNWQAYPGNENKKPSDDIKIDQIRNLQLRLQFHPLEAAHKLVIIDNADRMNLNTQNSLLKILEEPPPATHFILVSALPYALLSTIRSRSHRIDFGPLSDEEIANALMQTKKSSPEEASRIARLAGGSLGLATSVDSEFVAATIGRFLALSCGASSADIIQAAEEWSHSDQTQLRLIFDLIASFYRDCLRLLAVGKTNKTIHPETTRIAQRITTDGALKAISFIENARRLVDTTTNKQLMFENLLFSLNALMQKGRRPL